MSQGSRDGGEIQRSRSNGEIQISKAAASTLPAKPTGSHLWAVNASRKNEVAAIRVRFPYKLPVILERYAKEKILPALNKVKFLVPQEFTMGQLVAIIRNRMGLRCTQAFYFLLDGNHSLVNMSATMAEVYTTYKDEDGFLYMTYASQEMFG
ncbi:microtubule-associated proteins 1A/1B light chain 3C-like isoform X1 [Crotalus tigris]|uniref:microtubule-associated proteins 1A/1B light chain 3C-like isoform X1 n=1 Tax=Crotalus tigris TaxID=88082 RepID=UPI00192F61BA|nr:microtubule-associated proteins 1A/1B light chain 3C-like isoform X1 [Crotalus tigris]